MSIFCSPGSPMAIAQYGECYGPSLDSLIAKGYAVVDDEESGLNNSFIAKGRDLMYRTVTITDAGRNALFQ
jgi:hypothetical protein